jgi:hypothetical protein
MRKNLQDIRICLADPDVYLLSSFVVLIVPAQAIFLAFFG